MKFSDLIAYILLACFVNVQSSEAKRPRGGSVFFIDNEIGGVGSLADLAALSFIASGQPAIAFIDSRGGVVDMAFLMAREMVRLDVTCYVKKANSAALQVIMPACSKIVAAPETVLGFHDTHTVYSKETEMGMRDAIDLMESTRRYNDNMALWMMIRFGGDMEKCPIEAAERWAEFTSSCVGVHIYENTIFSAEEFNLQWPRPVLTIIPKNEFPFEW